MSSGYPDLDTSLLRLYFKMILDCVELILKTNHHNSKLDKTLSHHWFGKFCFSQLHFAYKAIAVWSMLLVVSGGPMLYSRLLGKTYKLCKWL